MEIGPMVKAHIRNKVSELEEAFDDIQTRDIREDMKKTILDALTKEIIRLQKIAEGC